jgi:capsid protein
MGIKEAIGRFFKLGGYPGIGDAVQAPSARSTYFGGGGRGAYYGGNGGSKWLAGLGASGASPIINHTLARTNARSAYHDSLQGRAIVERFADTVAYTGLKLNAAPLAKALGLTVDQAAEWARDVEEKHHIWAGSKTASRDESMTHYQQQRLAVIQQFRDGEYFARLWYDDDPGRINPLSASFVGADQIIYGGYTDTYFPDCVQTDGIERDKQGREVAYHVYVRQPDGTVKPVMVPARGPSGRIHFLHGFAAEYAGQTRGYPRISHIVQELENLTDFSSAHIKKAIAESAFVGVVEPGPDAPAINFAADHASGPLSQFQAPVAPSTDGEGVDEFGFPITFNTMNDLNVRPGAMIVGNLQANEKFTPFGGKNPSEAYGVFVEAVMTDLAASNSMPVEVVRMKFGENFSASRAALILAWQVIQIWVSELASDFLKPIYEEWLSGEIAAGRVSAPGWSDPRMRQAWLNCGWIGAPMPNIDPSKTTKALKDEVEMGAKDLDMVAQELNGTDGQSNRAKLVRQLAELPRVPWGQGSAPAAPEPDEPTEDEDDDEPEESEAE